MISKMSGIADDRLRLLMRGGPPWPRLLNKTCHYLEDGSVVKFHQEKYDSSCRHSSAGFVSFFLLRSL